MPFRLGQLIYDHGLPNLRSWLSPALSTQGAQPNSAILEFQGAQPECDIWWSGVVVSTLALFNKVNLHRARLVLR